ncbi:MAG: ABC transporter permease [Acidimicrobiia bacterium]|nr:ABC transporter permease [Acidimicrobiia bacterium]
MAADTDLTVPPATQTATPGGSSDLDRELEGLDNLERPQEPTRPLVLRAWSVVWPKVAAIAIGIGLWQLAVWAEWKPETVLPPPAKVFGTLWDRLVDGLLIEATMITMQRAVAGFALALLIGVVVGGLVSQLKVLRIAFGSFITGLQTMPSIAWFPLAILFFGLNEQAIFFVVVLGATPSIANGLISGVDHIPPLYKRAGRVLGAKGLSMFRFVIVPAAMPSFVAGLKQGWAFAWRSLMAGELLVVIAGRPSIGFQLQFARELNRADLLIATMIMILIIGIVVDSVVFGSLERSIRRRRGLLDT